MEPPRTAFVLGAGLGTRLRPLTARRPKPLIPVAGRPLITHAFDHLIGAGIERFVVNTHWCAERFHEFFPDGKWRGRPITFTHETPEILDTAGGIWHARQHLSGGPFILYNGDILSDLPIAQAIQQHIAARSEITLILRSHGPNPNVTFDAASGHILDLRRTIHPEKEPAHQFTGISIIQPEFIRRIPAGEKIGLVPILHEMIRAGTPPRGIVLDHGTWRDLGTREEYLQACAHLGHPQWISPAATIGPGAQLHDCIVWEKATVALGARLTRCIITDGATAEGTHQDADF